MNPKTLQGAIALGKETGRVFVATADSQGLPHIAAAGEIDFHQETLVTVSAWFCPSTMANLKKNPLVSLVVWNEDQDVGYQLLGSAEKTEDVAMMDGYAGPAAEAAPLPQEERRLTLRVEHILHFSLAPHSDLEE
jgi:hypothetical protein